MLTRAVLSAAVAALLLFPSSAGASRGCGWIVAANGGLVDVRVDRGHASCGTARSIIRRYLGEGDRCVGSACSRRVSGWTRLGVLHGFPGLTTCRRAGARVVAYAVGD